MKNKPKRKDNEMKLFVYHYPSGQAFLMRLNDEQYESVAGLPNMEVQDVPFVEREIKRRFGDKPHFLDVNTHVCAMLDGETIAPIFGDKNNPLM